MAIVKITNTKLKRNEAQEITAAAAVDATAGASIDYSNQSDGKILINNGNSSAAKKATILKGNALQGVEDLEISIPAGKTYGIVVESGKFENVSGDNKGKVIIKGESADITIQTIELP